MEEDQGIELTEEEKEERFQRELNRLVSNQAEYNEKSDKLWETVQKMKGITPDETREVYLNLRHGEYETAVERAKSAADRVIGETQQHIKEAEIRQAQADYVSGKINSERYSQIMRERGQVI